MPGRQHDVRPSDGHSGRGDAPRPVDRHGSRRNVGPALHGVALHSPRGRRPDPPLQRVPAVPGRRGRGAPSARPTPALPLQRRVLRPLRASPEDALSPRGSRAGLLPRARRLVLPRVRLHSRGGGGADRARRPAAPRESLEVLFLLIVGSWWSTSRLDKWRCPRCGNRFFARLYNNPFTDKCMHCGLPNGRRDQVIAHDVSSGDVSSRCGICAVGRWYGACRGADNCLQHRASPAWPHSGGQEPASLPHWKSGRNVCGNGARGRPCRRGCLFLQRRLFAGFTLTLDLSGGRAGASVPLK